MPNIFEVKEDRGKKKHGRIKQIKSQPLRSPILDENQNQNQNKQTNKTKLKQNKTKTTIK